MPASYWNYFVPYETDPAFALQRLREEVFERGEYKSFLDAAMPVSDGFSRGNLSRVPALQPHHHRLDLSRLFTEWNRPLANVNHSGPRPGSIRELLDRQAGAGTHSILDITGLSTRPATSCINPLSSLALVELFGSDSPDHFDIKEAFDLGLLARYIGRRWQGIYLTAFRDSQPDEIFFAGRSGS